MRILLISQYFWPETFRVNDLVMSLRERGHDVDVLTGMPNYPSGNFAPGYGWLRKWVDHFEGKKIWRVPLWPRGDGGRLNLSLNYLSFVFSAVFMGLWRLPGKYACTFVFCPSPITVCLPAILYKFLTGTPVVIWVQDLWPESISAVGAVRSRWLLKPVELLVRFIYRYSDLIFVQSQAFVPNIRRFCAEADTKIRYLPNWAEELYQPIPRPDANVPAAIPTGFCVMFAGNVGKAQAMDTIVKAAEILRLNREIHWVIVGDGSERNHYEALVAQRGLSRQFHFLGRFPVNTMPAFFAHADALLVTLKDDQIFADTIPSKVQSYLACARPVIAALNGEGQRVLKEAGALTGNAEDAEALASNVARLFEMPESEREKLGQRGKEYYRRCFARRFVIDRLETDLREMEVSH